MMKIKHEKRTIDPAGENRTGSFFFFILYYVVHRHPGRGKKDPRRKKSVTRNTIKGKLRRNDCAKRRAQLISAPGIVRGVISAFYAPLLFV